MEDKFKHNLPKGMGKIEEAKPAVKTTPIAPFREPSGQMPAPEAVPVVVEKPDPKPTPRQANQKTKINGITFIAAHKKFHAEFTQSGRTLNVGLFDTLELAEKALNKEKSAYNM